VTAGALLVAMLLILAINIGVLAVTVKLYTEILKDRKFDHRAETKGHDGGRDLRQSVRPARREL
jgi:hypothetical protein